MNSRCLCEILYKICNILSDDVFNFSSVRRSPTMRPQQDSSRSFCSCCCPPLLLCSFLVPLGLLSVHFFGCLPLFLVPSTCPYSATAGSLLPPFLVTFPNHVSLLFLILSISVISCPSSNLEISIRILSLLDLPSIFLSQVISATSIHIKYTNKQRLGRKGVAKAYKKHPAYLYLRMGRVDNMYEVQQKGKKLWFLPEPD